MKDSDQPKAGAPSSRAVTRDAALSPSVGGSAEDDFLLEIGTEELPVSDLESALEQLREKIPALLGELRLAHGAVTILGTPRRLVAHVAALSARQPDRTSVVKGPPADKAFDSLGQPTRAAEGFAKSRGVALGDLQVREIDGGRYVAAVVEETGKPAPVVLAGALPGLLASIRFDKTMRWNSSNVAFSRPIRWLLALHGGEVVPFEYAGYSSGRETRGLRFRQPETIAVDGAQAYFDALKAQGIILDPAARKAAVAEQARALTEAAGGVFRDDPALLDEVANLVEAPTAFRGQFDPSHLRLPAEVLVSVMKKHQRYFPVYKNGELLPFFIGVRNGDARQIEVVTDGNEQVVRARFADAAFFINEDVKHSLESYLPRLGTLVFQKKLGSMLDKTHRIQRLVENLVAPLGLDNAEAAVARRAAQLCKADLVTHMVIEMTSLQGLMGRTYALNSGEPQAVGQAIYEHYLPRYAGDANPQGKAGLAVGIADRLDTLAGLFAAGLAPSGTKDPFAQRRAALGLVQALTAWAIDFDLAAGLGEAAKGLPLPAAPEALAACLEFIVGRERGLLIDSGNRYDVVDAVLAEQRANPAGAARAINVLSDWVARPDWNSILPAYARCVRITRDQQQIYTVDPAAFADPPERELFAALRQAEASPRKPGSMDDFFAAFLPLMPAINRFFEAVLVMAEDPAQRANRLGMLQRIAALAKGVADFSLLEGF